MEEVAANASHVNALLAETAIHDCTSQENQVKAAGKNIEYRVNSSGY
jgi:hypothetical protein